jgi:thioesterase domain-containing protein
MAEAYLRQVGHLLDGPVVLTGLSYGGLVAYEMGRRLARAGLARAGLARAGHRGPSVVLLDTLGTDDPARRAAVEPVDLAEFRDKLVRFNGMYPGIDDEQIDQYHRIYNHNRSTMRDYPTPPSPARLVLLQATAGRDESFLREVRAFWRRRGGAGFRLEQVHCDHWDILESAEVLRVAALLRDELDRLGDVRAATPAVREAG